MLGQIPPKKKPRKTGLGKQIDSDEPLNAFSPFHGKSVKEVITQGVVRAVQMDLHEAKIEKKIYFLLFLYPNQNGLGQLQRTNQQKIGSLGG